MERGADRKQVEVDPDLFFRLNPGQVSLDEAQELPQIFPALRVAIDADREVKGRFVITGSSSPDLIKNISESLAGRVGIIEMAPFSLDEAFERPVSRFYRLFTGELKPSAIESLAEASIDVKNVHTYWLRGGYPEPWVSGDAGFVEAWQENYFKSYFYRDIAGLFPKLNKERFRLFIKMLAGLSGRVINNADIARALDLSQPTIKDYFEIAHGTFFWRQIRPFDRKSVRRIVRHPKGIIRDSGLLHHLLKIDTQQALIAHPQMGLSWEGMVIEQIIRSLETIGVPHEYSYYRTSDGREIDLVIEGAFGMIPIEVKYPSAVSQKDLSTLKQFTDEFGCRFGVVVSNRERPAMLAENIVSIPAGCL